MFPAVYAAEQALPIGCRGKTNDGPTEYLEMSCRGQDALIPVDGWHGWHGTSKCYAEQL
jgi:hypothetical protein